MSENNTGGSENVTYHIPTWFIRLASTLMLLTLPWAGWVSVTVHEIKIRQEDTRELKKEVAKLTDQVNDLRIKFASIKH